MSVLEDVFGAGGVSSLLSNVIDKIWPDPAKAAEAKAALIQAEQAGQLEHMKQEFQLQVEQIKVNAVEAASGKTFVAGWRPFCGWVCGCALAYATILQPFASFVARTFFNYSGQFPVLDTTLTMQALFGMLGLGIYRSAEKIKSAQGTGH